VYNSLFIISDSGTAQEEPALFNTPVIVPRDYTERPESMLNNCSFMLNINTIHNSTWSDSFSYIKNILNEEIKIRTEWLGDGNTSQIIVDKIKEIYDCR